jgi:uncharacterized protein (UPF0276 family)
VGEIQPQSIDVSSSNSLGLGLGLRYPHIAQVLAGEARVNWFEVISENYMDSGGRSKYDLKKVAENYPLAFHGVSLSIGSTDPLNFDYLHKLKSLTKEIPPLWVSDHLCWTGIQGVNSHDLLPVPLNEESLLHISERVKTVQDFLERQIVLENPSTYLRFAGSTIDEPDFIRYLCEETDCGLLLDVNNVFVTAFNAGLDPKAYLAKFPFDRVVQMHLAGHEDCQTHIIDTHDRPVRKEVWELFQVAWKASNHAPTCLEWDSNIPSLQACEDEVFKAKQYIDDIESPLNEPIPDRETQAVSTPIEHLVPNILHSVIETESEI